MAAEPVDFRMGIDGLAAVVQQALGLDPFAGDLFVFRAKRADRVTILAWDGTGVCRDPKRLEAGRFRWPPPADGVVRRRGESICCGARRAVAGWSAAMDSSAALRTRAKTS